MLDQNVPNPLAKNPNFNTTKVFAAIGIILIVIIVIGIGIWYFVQSAEDKANKVEESTPITVATTSAKPKTTTSSAIPSDWKTYTSASTTFHWSIRYPREWTNYSQSGFLDNENKVPYDTLWLNRGASESQDNGKTNISIFWKFQGDFNTCSFEKCTTDSINLGGRVANRTTVVSGITKGDEFYTFKDGKDPIIFTSPNGNPDLVHKVLETIKFL